MAAAKEAPEAPAGGSHDSPGAANGAPHESRSSFEDLSDECDELTRRAAITCYGARRCEARPCGPNGVNDE